MGQFEKMPATPTLLDAVLLEINDTIGASVPWLNNRYGQAEKLRKRKDGSVIESNVLVFPSVYSGKKGDGYFNLLPDKSNGNYSFFIIEQPEVIKNFRPNGKQKFEIKYSLVVWYKINTLIMPENENRNQELIKKQLINAIATASGSKLTLITIESTEKDPERIFKEYSFNEINQQYLMHPYGALRLNGKLIYEESCT